MTDCTPSKAQVEAIQKTGAVTEEEPPTPPPRDDSHCVMQSPEHGQQPEVPAPEAEEEQAIQHIQEEENVAPMCPVAPPPPTPFKTPLLRRTIAKTLPGGEAAEMAAPIVTAPLSELIREQTRSALKVCTFSTCFSFSLSISLGSHYFKQETGIPRSPGGTPMRRHSLAAASPRNLLSSALNRKFRSVRLPQSPVFKAAEEQQAEDDEWENAVENK
jgi:hypothetical protein